MEVVVHNGLVHRLLGEFAQWKHIWQNDKRLNLYGTIFTFLVV